MEDVKYQSIIWRDSVLTGFSLTRILARNEKVVNDSSIAGHRGSRGVTPPKAFGGSHSPGAESRNPPEKL